jgi:hypothetical protein
MVVYVIFEEYYDSWKGISTGTYDICAIYKNPQLAIDFLIDKLDGVIEEEFDSDLDLRSFIMERMIEKKEQWGLYKCEIHQVIE